MSKAGALLSTMRYTLPLAFPAWWGRAAIFVALISIYAFLSSSTPDEFGIPEALMGLLLVVFVGFRGATLSLGGFLMHRQNAVPSIAYWSFLVLVTVLSLWGLIIRQNQLSDYIRDVVPLLYLFLPVFFVPQMTRHRDAWQKLCIAALCVIGVAYSVRHFMSDEVGIAALGHAIVFGDSNYFPMDPAVLFASTFLLTSGLVKLFDGKWITSAAYLMLGAVAFASLLGVLVRAQIFLVLMSLLFILVVQSLRSPRVLIFGIAPLCAGLVFVVLATGSDFAESLFGLMVAKSESAGLLNSRDLEAQVVINNAMSSLDAMLLGEGWGGVVDNPAGGGVVRFTHNIEIYGLLKGGLIGSLFVGLYAFVNIRDYLKDGWRTLARLDILRLPLMLAIGNVLCLNLLLEPGFKMFSFGLVLTVLWLSHSSPVNGRILSVHRG